MQLNKKQVNAMMEEIGGLPLHVTVGMFYKCTEIGKKIRNKLNLPEKMKFVTLHGHKGGHISGYALEKIVEPFSDRVRREAIEEMQARRAMVENEKKKKAIGLKK